MDKKEIKARKKAYKKALKRARRPWKFLSLLSIPLAIILVAATVVCTMFDNTIALFTGGTFWELENEDPNAVYFEGDFATEE
jgi:beta-glucosidase